MNIKKVTIRGFKAFGDLVTCGDFSPGKNCVFGLNGSGKSTFVQAIEFVLLDEFSHLRPTERQSLLHSGTTTATTAFVEITFDNTDKRLPVSQDVVAIRRSIGLNKDEYFINRKQTSRNEIRNLFETAGISLSSGLFIVQQGRVKIIADMNDEGRLGLLYDVAGIRSYDDKREESIKLMGEAKMRREKIDDAIGEIKKRLAELEEETAELRDFEKWDKAKRAVEFLIYDRERERASKEAAVFEEDLAQATSIIESLRMEIGTEKENVKKLKVELREAKERITEEEDTIKQARKRKEVLTKREGNYQIRKRSLEKELSKATEDEEVLKMEIRELEGKLGELEEVLANMSNEHNQLEEKKQLMSVLALAPQQIEKERESVRDEINTLQQAINGMSEQMSNIEHELGEMAQQKDSLVQTKQELLKARTSYLSEKTRLRNQRLDHIDEQKKAWRTQSELERKLKGSKLALSDSERRLELLMGKSRASAVTFLRAKGFDLGHGMLIDLVQCDPELFVAVDSVAKGKLFYLVVDTYKQAEKVIKALNENKAGRLSIFSLDMGGGKQLSPIPKMDGVSPLIDELRFDEKIRPAVEHVFGSVALCKNEDVAAEVSTNHNILCVTLTGELFDPKGPVYGGEDPSSALRRSPMRYRMLIEKHQHELKETESSLLEIRERVAEVEEKLRISGRDLEEHKKNKIRLEIELNKVDEDLLKLDSDGHEIHEKKIELARRITNLQRDLKMVETKEHEITHSAGNISVDHNKMLDIFDEFARKLHYGEPERHMFREYLDVWASSANPQQKGVFMNVYTALCGSCANSYLSLQQARVDSETLSGKIRKLAKSPSLKRNETEDELANIEAKIENANNEMAQLSRTIDECERSVDEQKALVEELTSQKNSHEDSLMSIESKLFKEQQMANECNKSMRVHQIKLDEIQRKISAIGPLPTVEIEERREQSHSELMQEMHRCTSELTRFRFVNKRAQDQFRQFSDKREELEQRQQEMISSESAIVSLISDLDSKKHTAIQDCVRKVSEKFSSIYKVLEPNRSATIVPRTAGLESSDPRQIVGIGIDIGATPIGALSGGQRTIIALALIFAIQQMEPSPFYIFDEVDADLDVDHRSRLGDFITDMSTSGEQDGAPVQFIFTTHRDELLSIADKFFAVHTTGSSSSTIKEVSLEEVSQYRDNEEE